MAHSDRITALEKLVAKYEKSREDFASIQRELRRLSGSGRLDEVVQANAETLASAERMLAMTQERLRRERTLAAAPVRPTVPAHAQSLTH